jgi:hypothetical protein
MKAPYVCLHQAQILQFLQQSIYLSGFETTLPPPVLARSGQPQVAFALDMQAGITVVIGQMIVDDLRQQHPGLHITAGHIGINALEVDSASGLLPDEEVRRVHDCLSCHVRQVRRTDLWSDLELA